MDWRDASKTIGESVRSDNPVDIETHRAAYAETAPELVRLFDWDAPKEQARAFISFDEQAITTQTQFRRWMRLANLGAFFTSVFSAAAMAVSLSAPPTEPVGFSINAAWILSIFALIAAVLGAVAIAMLRQGKLLETWMGKRALAESHRISYFEGLITKAAGLSTESALLTLEYFRRYQFDNQKAYYQRRSREHDISAKRTVAIGAVGAGVATLAGASGVVTAGQETWLGAFTIFGSALGAFAIGREQMTQDRRNAERYTRTYSSLVELTKRLDSVRQAVSGGNTRAAVEFVKVVDEQLSTEHRQWLKETEATNEAIARLDEALKETANG